MKALEIQKLIRRFGDLTAVDNVDITISESEIYGLLGPNGAGKSTTINIICGLLRQDAVTVSVFGQDTLKQSNATKSMIGVVPQDIAIAACFCTCLLRCFRIRVFSYKSS